MKALARRGFLRMLGGAVAAGPAIGKSAADMTLADTRLWPQGLSAGNLVEPPVPHTPSATHARSMLEELKRGGEQARRLRRTRLHLEGLEPDLATMRSLSLTTKVRLSRDRAFERHERTQAAWFTGIIKGWWIG